jgi:hypothetical protein
MGVITLPGFTSWTESVTGADAIQLPPGGSLAIVAAPFDNALVTVTGGIEVTGLPAPVTQAGTTPPSGQLLLSGIWLAGQLTVSGAPCTVEISDCTLVPGHGLLPDDGPGSPLPLHPGEPSVLVSAEAGASLVLTRVISGRGRDDLGHRQRPGRDLAVLRRARRAGPGLRRAGPDHHGQHGHRQGPRPDHHARVGLNLPRPAR